MKRFILITIMLASAVGFAKELAWSTNDPDERVIEYHIYTTTHQGVYKFGLDSPNFLVAVPAESHKYRFTSIPAVQTWAVVTAFNGILEGKPSKEVDITAKETGLRLIEDR
jgi:hypothetical protein